MHEKNYQNTRILHDSCPRNYQNTRIFVIFTRKINKIAENFLIIAEFYMIFFARKRPKFYIIIALKICFPNFGGHVPPCPLYPTPMDDLDLSDVKHAFYTDHWT